MRPATTTAISVTILLLIALAIPDPVVARPLSVEDLFRPFEYLNVEDIYDRYSTLIDLLISLLIFVGLAQATLGHRYPGPGGRAVAVGVGLSLAISLLIAETTWGFNLKSLGPLAAGIVILVLGVMIYQFLHKAGMSRTGATGAAYLAAFFGIVAAAPGLVDWLNTNIPLLSTIAIFGILAALLALLTGLHFQPMPFPDFSNRWRIPRWNSPRHQRRVKELDQEVQYLKKGAAPAVDYEVENGRSLENQLRALRAALERRGAEPNTHQNILRDLERIATKAETIQEDIRRVWELNNRLQEFDRELFHEDYVREVEAMTPQEQNSLKQDIQQQLRKIAAEKRLQEIQTTAAKHLQALRAFIEETVDAVKEGITTEAIAAMERAIRAAQAISALARQTKALEKALLKFTKRQKRTAP